SLGFTTDVFTAPGHPGFPQQGDLVEYNNFYSNNFNPYVASSDIAPSEPEPVGTGFWIAGGNDNVVRYNHFYDNWRRGAMLFAGIEAGGGYNPALCAWFATPPKPSSSNASGQRQAALGVATDPHLREQVCRLYGDPIAPVCAKTTAAP